MEHFCSWFANSVDVGDLFKLSTWRSGWTTYALYDKDYIKSKSFGFLIDSGNGLSTLPPMIIWVICSIYECLPAILVGIIGILSFYQMYYGTILYFSSFCFNKKYKSMSTSEAILCVGIPNGFYLIFPLVGMYAGI